MGHKTDLDTVKNRTVRAPDHPARRSVTTPTEVPDSRERNCSMEDKSHKIKRFSSLSYLDYDYGMF